jgi:hypothetical protein
VPCLAESDDTYIFPLCKIQECHEQILFNCAFIMCILFAPKFQCERKLKILRTFYLGYILMWSIFISNHANVLLCPKANKGEKIDIEIHLILSVEYSLCRSFFFSRDPIDWEEFTSIIVILSTSRNCIFVHLTLKILVKMHKKEILSLQLISRVAYILHTFQQFCICKYIYIYN